MFKSTILQLIKKLHNFVVNDDILVLGDSHALVFNHWLFWVFFPFKRFKVISVGGATASGLDNPNSKTQALIIFHNALESFSGSQVIIMLGEVDTGFVIWYRSQKYNESVEYIQNTAVTHYCQFLSNIPNSKKVTVVSTPLPTIKDDNTWGEVANLRKEISASQKERTALTLKFNQNIQNYCFNNQFNYIDLDNDSLGRDGLVKPELLNKVPTDHHYNYFKHASLICKKLKSIL